MRRILFALALVIWSAAAQEPGGYAFFLDGERLEPQIVSLEGTPEAPRPGDLARIRDDLWITLGEPGEYRFRFADGDLSRLLLEDRVVAVRVFRGAAGGIVNPLATMPPKEIRALKGLCLLEWDEAILKSAALADPAATLTVMCDEREVPPLPPTVERLCILGNPWAGAHRLADLGALRAFVATDYSGRFDWADLDAPLLRAAIAPATRSGDLVRFPELRVLDLSDSRLARVEFAKEMPHLRILDLAGTLVTDLSPLEGHPALVRVVAPASVERLPTGRMPALRRLVAYGVGVSAEQWAAFRKANPDCAVEFEWEPALREAVAGCDQLLVHKGGALDLDEKDTLFEIRARAAIEEVLATIQIDEAKGEYRCRCGGDPTLEFCTGDRVVVSLTLHHAHGVRFGDRPWSGGGALTPASAEALCEWLARHGVPGPLENHRENIARAKAWEARLERSRRILGEETWRRFRAARDAATARAALASVAQTDEARVHIWLSLLGCHEGGWNLCDIETVLDRSLRAAPGEALCAALRRAVADPWACAGAACWILGHEHWDRLDDATLKGTLPALARSGLAHPRPYSRRRTLIALSKIGGNEATAALRAALAGVPPRELAPDEVAETAGGAWARAEPAEIGAARSDRAVAAFFLAQLGDRNSLSAMRDLLGQLQGEDRALVEKAIELLESGR